MKAIFVFALMALAALCAAEESKVIVLTNDNFDTIVNEAETILVKFYAPWCGHCKHLAPEYIKAAATLEKEGVILAEVDATVETKLADRFDVHGYPTLYVFHKGVKSEYKGPRDHMGIVKYMRAQAGPAAKPLDKEEDLKAFIDRADVDIKFVAYTKADSSVGKAFINAANTLRENYVFGITPATADRKDTIVAFRNFGGKEEKEVVYAGKNDADAIRKWVQETAIPLAGVYDENTKVRYGALPILFVYSKISAENDPAGLRYILNRLRPVAGDFKGKLNFVAADRNDNNFHEMDLDSTEKFQVAIVDGEKLYKSDIKALDKEKIKAFAQSFVDGKAEQFIKSEEIPAPAKAGEVEVIVGKSFDEKITKTETDTFIVAYAPWCGHCKALLPTWEKLAEKYNVDGSKVRFTKIDATANFLPSKFEVRGYPSIFFVPAGKGAAPMKYESGREMADFETYLKSHASKNSKPLTFAEEKKEL